MPILFFFVGYLKESAVLPFNLVLRARQLSAFSVSDLACCSLGLAQASTPRTADGRHWHARDNNEIAEKLPSASRMARSTALHEP
jgi:hypothetical protein